MEDIETYRRELEQKHAAYQLFSSLFLTLPDEALVNSLLAGSFTAAPDDAGMRFIADYAAERRGLPIEDTVVDLAKDRAHVIRGVNANEIRPPYESLYVDNPATGTIGSLNRFYAELGYCMTDEVKETADQIGVEFAFVTLLIEGELAALDAESEREAARLSRTRDSFMSQHLGRWMREYAKAMRERAQTGFYRGVATMIMEAA